MDCLITGDDLILVGVLPIAKNKFTVYDNIANGGPIQRKHNDRQQIFSRMSGDGCVIQINGEEIGE